MSSVRIIERSLSVYPECIHAWIESLGPVEEILDIHIKNEVLAELVESWVTWKPVFKRTITVFHESRQYVQSFICKEGIWQIVQLGGVYA
jgi:hypothetical protein